MPPFMGGVQQPQRKDTLRTKKENTTPAFEPPCYNKWGNVITAIGQFIDKEGEPGLIMAYYDPEKPDNVLPDIWKADQCGNPYGFTEDYQHIACRCDEIQNVFRIGQTFDDHLYSYRVIKLRTDNRYTSNETLYETADYSCDSLEELTIRYRTRSEIIDMSEENNHLHARQRVP